MAKIKSPCRHYARYKGIRPPRCGCDMCWKKYRSVTDKNEDYRLKNRLTELKYEADRLADANNGIHDMSGFKMVVRCCWGSIQPDAKYILYRPGEALTTAEEVVKKMRVLAATRCK